MKSKIEYYSFSDEGLANGSFVRRSKYGLAQFANGDFLYFIEEVPERFKPVSREHAESLLPAIVNAGKGKYRE